MDSTRCKGSRTLNDPRLAAIPDSHGHAKGEHKLFAEERPIAYSARMLFLWFYHACRRGMPRFVMVADHINYLTFEDPGAVHTVRRALKLAEAGDLYGAAETAGVDVAHAAVVSQGLRRGMRFSIGAELDNDPRSRPDAQNIVDAMRPDAMIRSVHFLAIEHPEKGADWQWPFDNPEFKDLYEVVGTERVWELYIERLADDVEKLPGHIVGHFYAPATFGHWPETQRLEAYEDRILALCLARGMAIEVDTRPLYRNSDEAELQRYREANLRLMRKAKERGVPIAIGSDAHSPKDQGGAFDVVLAMLDEAEINEIVFPVGGRLARVALRATKEHLEKLKQQEPPAAVPGSSISGMGRAELGLPERDDAEIAREEAAAARSAREEGSKRRTASPARSKKRATAKAADESSSHERPAKGGPGPDVAAPAALAAAGESVKDAAEALRPKARTASKKRPAKPAGEQAAAAAPPARVAEPKRVEPARAATAETKSRKAAPAAKGTPPKRPAPKTAPATKSKASATKAAAKSPARATASKGAKSTARAKSVKASSTATKRPTKSKPTAKKATPSKTAVKKTPAKSAPAKKATAKKPVPKAAPKRAAAKKASKPVRKPAPKKPARKATSKRR